MYVISIIITLFVFSSYVHGEILNYNISKPRILEFDYKTICQESGISYSTIIKVKNSIKLDCMGTEVNVSKFCQKKFKHDLGLLRGVIIKNKKLVYCQFGKEAILSLSCDKKHRHLCNNPLQGCLELKNVYAFNLSISHHSLIEERPGYKKINCYYQRRDVGKKLTKLKKDLSE